MNIDLTKYQLTGRLLFGANLKLVFESKGQEKEKKILDLQNIAGFTDYLDKTDNLKWLSIRDGGGSYSHDLALRLKSEKVMNNKEVFVFVDDESTQFIFRCSADKVDFRNYQENEFS